MRVASSSALAARYLARNDSSTLALFGSGWQAGSHLPAMCAVQPIKLVNVFSPTKANRDAFVKEMQPKVSAEVRAVNTPEEAIKDADIIAATTNSLTRVVDADWVKPGLHLTCVRVPELGDDTIRRIDRLVIHAHQHAPKNYIAGFGEEGIEAHDAIEVIGKGPERAHEIKVEHPFWLSAPELKDLVTAKTEGRAKMRGNLPAFSTISASACSSRRWAPRFCSRPRRTVSGGKFRRIGFSRPCTPNPDSVPKNL